MGFSANRLAGVLWGKMINNYWAHGPCRTRRTTFVSDWSPESVGVWLFSSLARHGFPFLQWQLVTPQRLQLSRKRTSQSRASLSQDILCRAIDIYQVEFGPGKADAELARWQKQLTATVESATFLFSVHCIIRGMSGVDGQRSTRRVDIRGFCPLGSRQFFGSWSPFFRNFQLWIRSESALLWKTECRHTLSFPILSLVVVPIQLGTSFHAWRPLPDASSMRRNMTKTFFERATTQRLSLWCSSRTQTQCLQQGIKYRHTCTSTYAQTHTHRSHTHTFIHTHPHTLTPQYNTYTTHTRISQCEFCRM